MSPNAPQLQLVLLAPVTGVPVRLEDVPDPVFSQRMVGDGLAIDPLDGTLLAPCDGEVVLVHPAGHAVTLRTPGGIEVLMHVGLDTVEMRGEGFTPKVRAGQTVSPGTPLIAFDLDRVATGAKSALTLVLVTTPGATVTVRPTSGVVTAGRDAVLTVGGGAAAAAEPTGGGAVTSDVITVPNPTGLHARPAAVVAAAARAFRSDVGLHLDGRRANAKSVTAIMSLDVRHGARVRVAADGPDAADAVAAVADVLRSGAGEGGPAAPAAAAVPARSPVPLDSDLLAGVAAAPGLGVGTLFRVRYRSADVAEHGGGPAQERHRLDAAIAAAVQQLDGLAARLRVGHESNEAAIFAAHAELLSDPDLVEDATTAVDQGRSAAFAWRAAFRAQADRLAGMSNPLLAQRATDVRDVGERVLGLLTGVERTLPPLPDDAILVAEDLTPSETAQLDADRVAGLCTTGGGATSHVAILARSLGIPALAGVDARVLDVADGTPAILDGGRGLLRLTPSAAEMDEVRTVRRADAARRATDQAAAAGPAVTTDGHRVEVAANVGDVGEAARVTAAGGEGVGLLRSEFLFMDRAAAPTEDEQFAAYRQVAAAVAGPVIIRTLDVGGDKPLAYLPLPPEENPFLGQRGIRVCLDQPHVLRTQVRAILRAAAAGQVKIMFPMVATVEELRRAKAIVAEQAAALGIAPVPVGIMVEVPAVAAMAERFAAECDFFSIGTNDLTQYTLAMDRGNAKLASAVDGLNPAVLRLIWMTVAGARAHGRWVGVCGGMAGDAAAVPLLVGLGVDELSVSIPVVPTVKAQVRTLDREACRKLADEALTCGTAAEVRALVGRFAASAV